MRDDLDDIKKDPTGDDTSSSDNYLKIDPIKNLDISNIKIETDKTELKTETKTEEKNTDKKTTLQTKTNNDKINMNKTNTSNKKVVTSSVKTN